jgi:HEAT repeat protein
MNVRRFLTTHHHLEIEPRTWGQKPVISRVLCRFGTCFRAKPCRSSLTLVVTFGCLLVPAGLLSANPNPAQISTATVMGEADSDSEHLNQLEICKSGLLDAEAREEQRRLLARLLLTYDSPQASQVVVELLGRSDRPKVQRTLCEEIAERARRAPDKLDKAWIEPLIAMLGRTEEGLSVGAARTLAEFPGGEVPARLGEMAGNAEMPLPARLAAIDALAPNAHRREVVHQLITLLNSNMADISKRAADALEPATLDTFGHDADRWRTWWESRSDIRHEDWLSEQLMIYRVRARRASDELASLREQSRQSQAAMQAQFLSLQRELFRSLPSEQRDGKLVEWLSSPLPLVNQGALALIKARIADEGKRPEGEVQTALLRLLREGAPETLRELLSIVQTINDPLVVDAVLSLLDRVTVAANRHLVLAALGMFDDPRTVPALIREIASPDAPVDCVREAAIALGRIAGRMAANDLPTVEAVAALKQRAGVIDASDTSLRAAVLSAMAGFARSERAEEVAAFTEEFLIAVESDEAAILQPAIRGLKELGDTSKLARLRSLTEHADPIVRLAAVQALAELGSENADLERLLTRLNPSNESNGPVREAAWTGFREYMSRRGVGERIQAADRLRDLPELMVRYLSELADSMAPTNGNTSDLATVLDRLGVALMNQGKYTEAATRLRQLFEIRSGTGYPDTFDVGLRWLRATLRAKSPTGLSEFVARLFGLAGDGEARERIVNEVRQVIELPSFSEDPIRARAILNELRMVTAEHLPDSWGRVLRDAELKLAQVDTTSGTRQ